MQQVFSPSSLDSYETCPKKYHFRYVEKLPVDSEGIEAFVGKRVHEVLERLYRFTDEGRVPSLERVVWRFHQMWHERFDAKRLRIVRRETDFDDYRRQGVRCLENAYRQLYPFDRDETLGLEHPIQFRLGGGDYRLRGIIDRLVRAPDGVLEIHDYKTGKRVPHQAQLDRDRQLALYEIGVRQQTGEQGDVRLVWHYLLGSQVRTSTRTAEQRDELAASTRGVIDRIRCETEWKPVKSALCDWCEYRAWCPAFDEAAWARRPKLEAPVRPQAGAPDERQLSLLQDQEHTSSSRR